MTTTHAPIEDVAGMLLSYIIAAESSHALEDVAGRVVILNAPVARTVHGLLRKMESVQVSSSHRYKARLFADAIQRQLDKAGVQHKLEEPPKPLTERTSRIALSPTEVAEETGVSRVTVYQWFDRGLPSYKIGRNRRVLTEDLLEWLSSQEAE